jgi:5-methylthioadenosine/S-adenosylhomocysteine deaminase
MPKTLLRAQTVVTMDADRRVIPGGALLIDGGEIEAVLTPEQLSTFGPFQGERILADRFVCIPGFVQTHIHLCQTLFRGIADDLELLDWLRLRLLPLEAAHSASSMRASCLLGIMELLRSGTTTIMDMGSVRHEEEVVRALVESGMRAFVGKSMMDVNDLYPPLRESTREAITSTRHQAELWHMSERGRIRYAAAPRFILTCSDTLLRETSELISSFPGMLMHTHAAENQMEMKSVLQRCGKGNIEHFHALGILAPSTCLAHCIWLDANEISIMSESEAKVLHCPSSNLKLGSGIADIPSYLRRGISVSLGSDGAACNNTLDMFQEMRLAALIQTPRHGVRALKADEVFAMATLDGAEALGLEKEVGSLEPGKKADLVLLDLSRSWNSLSDERNVYSDIVYACSPENVQSVMIEGKWVYRDKQFSFLDEGSIVLGGKKELRSLLSRLNS